MSPPGGLVRGLPRLPRLATLRDALHLTAVILNWNRPQDTLAAVTSVLAQDYPDSDALVWDNASTDNSRQILEAAFAGNPRVQLEFASDNFGVAGGRNRAFRQARGQLLMSLDSDATIETRDAFTRIVARFAAEPDLGALSFEVRRPDGHLMWPFARPADAWRARGFDTIRVDGCSFVTPRALFDRIGGFAEHFSPYGAEDQYYAFQVIGQGLRVAYDPSVRVIHAFTPRGRQGRQFAMHVRNMVWMPLELFPFPHHLLRAGAQARYLWQEAKEQGQQPAYRQGLREALSGFRRSRRHPMPPAAWRRLRTLIAEDKQA